MADGKKILLGALAGFLLVAPLGGAQAGLFDWVHHLFGKKSKGQALSVSKLDSSSKWTCLVGGGCAGGSGICCVDGMESHLKGVEGIEKFQVDRKTGVVTLTIKKGAEVKVEEIQKALGRHWTIKTIEKQS